MPRLILLDAGAIGLLSSSPALAPVRDCRDWVADRIRGGDRVQVCELSDYEVRRELVRLGASAKLRRLDELCSELGLVPVDRRAWLKAAEFWALARRAGLPTADLKALDADVILAGVAATVGGPGDEVVVATSNVKHLGRFPGVDARPWGAIAGAK